MAFFYFLAVWRSRFYPRLRQLPSLQQRMPSASVSCTEVASDFERKGYDMVRMSVFCLYNCLFKTVLTQQKETKQTVCGQVSLNYISLSTLTLLVVIIKKKPCHQYRARRGCPARPGTLASLSTAGSSALHFHPDVPKTDNRIVCIQC